MSKEKVKGVVGPTQLPSDEDAAQSWQFLNKTWWETAPMRYDWRNGISETPGTAAYYHEIDRRFFDSARHYMPWKKRPFDRLIDFENLSDKKVLEIGVGHGSHAQLIAPLCASYTGIDITETAAKMTEKRLQIFNIPGRICRMDAESMAFRDQSFDSIWSWGVIHHSSDPSKILKEMHRVLKVNGTATVMIYHRSFWKYYVEGGFVRGLLLGGFRKIGNIHQIVQNATDGAIARYYKLSEWRDLCDGLFRITSHWVVGLKSEVVLFPGGLVKDILLHLLPDPLTRFLTNRCAQGSFLITKLVRI